MKKMKDLDSMTIEQIIHLPFFRSLEKELPAKGEVNTDKHWKITFHCNRKLSTGEYQLLDLISDKEYIVRYKLIDFK